MKRDTYIDNINIEEAKEKYYEKLKFQKEVEEIRVIDGVGRITSDPIYARISSPHYNAAAMDGIAVKSKSTDGASDIRPMSLKVDEDFIYVNTGNQIFEPYDAVIMIEDVLEVSESEVQIIKAAYPWQHIRQIGEDIVATEMIIPSKHKVRPMDLGALLSGGVEKIQVYRKPRVGIIPTGSEIIEDMSKLKDGKIMDSNSRVFEAYIRQLGGSPRRFSPVEDDYELLKDNIKKAVKGNDIVLINAGSSAGTKDFTVKLIRELGEVVIHGVAMKPGKPTILGIIDGKPVIGVPGFPVSSYIAFEEFIKPLIGKFIDYSYDEELVTAKLSKRMVSSLKSKEFVRVSLGEVDGKITATPISSGAGVTMSLVRADGIGIIPRNIEGMEIGEDIVVRLFNPLNRVKNKLITIGSHDLIIDIISDIMELSSTHVGSMGGILAVKRNECHIAPIHLLDMESGEYNISYVKKYFPDEKMVLIKGVQRKQGFIVEKGNPHNIREFKDLFKDNIVYANRQRGAGTRLLLDYHLEKEGIDPEKIRGYQRELTTHMAVASAVRTGTANVGLGVYSASQAMDLDFVEVADEDYDFLIPYKMLSDKRIKEFLKILKSEKFKSRVKSLGGYGFKDTGEIIVVE